MLATELLLESYSDLLNNKNLIELHAVITATAVVIVQCVLNACNNIAEFIYVYISMHRLLVHDSMSKGF